MLYKKVARATVSRACESELGNPLVTHAVEQTKFISRSFPLHLRQPNQFERHLRIQNCGNRRFRRTKPAPEQPAMRTRICEVSHGRNRKPPVRRSDDAGSGFGFGNSRRRKQKRANDARDLLHKVPSSLEVALAVHAGAFKMMKFQMQAKMKIAVVWLLLSTLYCCRVHGENVAFFYALEADLRAFQKEIQATETSTVELAGQKVQRGQWKGHTYFAVRMGSGSVVTAVAAQSLLASVRIDFAITVGPAGALETSVPAGAWRQVVEVRPFQSGTEAAAGFRPSKDALKLNFDAAKTLLEEISRSLQTTPGVAASGEVFCASETARDRIRLLTDASLIEMNLFGLAVACQRQRLPLLALRVVSDDAGETAGEDFRRFVESYAGAGGAAVGRALAQLAPAKNKPADYPALKALTQPK